MQCADVIIAKTPDNGTVNPGGTATFTILVTNVGPGVARNVQVVDTLPPGTWDISAPAGVTCLPDPATGSFTCTVAGDLLAGAANQLSITVSRAVTEADCGPLTNSASVSSTSEASINTGSSDTGLITVLCSALTLVKTPDQGTVLPGQTAQFTIVVTNTGANPALGVEVVDTLPPGSWTVSSTVGSCNSPAVGSFTCQIGTLAPNAFATITVSRTVSTSDCGPLNNSATASASNVPNDATDTGSITVLCSDLELEKIADDAPDLSGRRSTVQYQGDEPRAVCGDRRHHCRSIAARHLELPDLHLVGHLCLDLERNPNHRWPCLRPAAVLVERVDASRWRDHDHAEPHDQPRRLRRRSTTRRSPLRPMKMPTRLPERRQCADHLLCTDIRVQKTPDAGTVYPGEQAVFTITVTNLGPNVAQDVVITDTLPAGTWTVTTNPPALPNSIVAGVLTVQAGDIAVGGSVTVTLDPDT